MKVACEKVRSGNLVGRSDQGTLWEKIRSGNLVGRSGQGSLWFVRRSGEGTLWEGQDLKQSESPLINRGVPNLRIVDQ